MTIKYVFQEGKLICSRFCDSYEQDAIYGHYIAQKVGSIILLATMARAVRGYALLIQNCWHRQSTEV